MPELVLACDSVIARLWPLWRLGHPWDATRTPRELADAVEATDRALDALVPAREVLPVEVVAAVRPVLLDLKDLLIQTESEFTHGTWQSSTDARASLETFEQELLALTKYCRLPSWRFRARKRALQYAEDRMAP